MQWKTRWLWLFLGLAYLLGCTTLPTPQQPERAATHAILTFPSSMRLLSLNDQQIDTLTHLSQLRVPPGQHTLRFMHRNEGIDGSAEHAGQLAAPFILDVHAGITYHFESKT
ncbi:MAG: hypothetical protein O7G88_14325 [bacterium]|nr:hypothetical protein [bacterium]